MEERFLCHRIQGLVEFIVVFILEVSRLACPQRLDLIDHIVLIGVDILTVLPFLLLSEDHRHRHELAVFVQETLNARFLSKLLLILCNIQSDDSSSFSLFTFFHVILGRTVTRPLHSFCFFLP